MLVLNSAATVYTDVEPGDARPQMHFVVCSNPTIGTGVAYVSLHQPLPVHHRLGVRDVRRPWLQSQSQQQHQHPVT